MSTFIKSFDKPQIWLKSGKDTGNFTQRRKHLYDIDINKKHPVDQQCKENCIFISMATLKIFILLTATCKPTTQREGILAFLWQKCLRNSATTLRRLYNA
jgi:hypothetical protein